MKPTNEVTGFQATSMQPRNEVTGLEAVVMCTGFDVPPSTAERREGSAHGAYTYPVFDVIPHSFFEPMSYRIGVK